MELLDGYGMAFEDFKNELKVQVFSYDMTSENALFLNDVTHHLEILFYIIRKT